MTTRKQVMESDSDHELVLSDVHLTHSCSQSSDQVVRSRFLYQDCKDGSGGSELTGKKTSLVGADGDLEPMRKDEVHYRALVIEHFLATTLHDVGLQVWSASLLLCDFILHRREFFKSKSVLEVGAGVALPSVVSAMFADRVICTDNLDDAVKLCRRNFDANLTGSDDNDSKFKVFKLDWSWGLDDLESFGWPKQDAELLLSADIVLASDVIYNDDLTDSLFVFLLELLSRTVKDQLHFYFSLEKRLNFTLEDKDIACPAYEHFTNIIEEMCSSEYQNLSSFAFKCSQVKGIKQYFVYEKSKYLELWHLEATRKR